MAYPFTLDDLLKILVERGASDLHLAVGSPATMRLRGELVAMNDELLTADVTKDLIESILEPAFKQRLADEWEIDCAYDLAGLSRFRVNVCHQKDSTSAVMRVIPANPPQIEKMGYPAPVIEITNKPRGLVLVTGPTGSGKSTTLASMVDYINRNKGVRIVTIEDPIEFIHTNRKAVITQREVGRDTKSFSAALRSVLRQDPDVILVGEMRDLETISLALTAAETGHLVFGTLHVTSAPESINRMIDVFPPEQQEQVRIQLSSVLEGVFTQTLVPTADGAGRVCAMEIMLGSSAVRNLIRENKPAQMVNAIQTGRNVGMQTLDAALADFVKKGKITLDAAIEKSSNPEEVRRLSGR